MAIATNRDKLARLAKFGVWVPHDPELDDFAAYAERAGGISSAHWFGVEAEDSESEMKFHPRGGLTENHYRRLGRTPEEKAELARAVLVNLLRMRGHEIRAIEVAFRGIDEEALPALVEEYSFQEMAEAIETLVEQRPRPPQEVRPKAGSLGEVDRRNRPDTIGQMTTTRHSGAQEAGEDPACHPGRACLAEILQRLIVLEAKVGSLGPTTQPHGGHAGGPGDSFYLADEAAAYLRITKKALYSLKDRGKVKSLPGSRKLRFTKKALDDCLNERK